MNNPLMHLESLANDIADCGWLEVFSILWVEDTKIKAIIECNQIKDYKK